MTEYNNVTNPKHYMGRYGLEALEVHKNFLTEEELQGYYLGNLIKYALRYKYKNGLEDLKKARMHLNWLIEVLENEIDLQRTDFTQHGEEVE